VRRSTSWPELTSITTARGTSLRPAGRVLVAVVGPEADVTVGAGAVAFVVADVAVRARNDAADLVVGDRAGACFAGAAGRPAVVAVVDVSNVVAVDGLEGAGPAVDDVVASVEAMAAGSSVPPSPLQADAARTRTAPRAARRKRMVTEAYERARVAPQRQTS
jgi:hypothetical protein